MPNPSESASRLSGGTLLSASSGMTKHFSSEEVKGYVFITVSYFLVAGKRLEKRKLTLWGKTRDEIVLRRRRERESEHSRHDGGEFYAAEGSWRPKGFYNQIIFETIREFFSEPETDFTFLSIPFQITCLWVMARARKLYYNIRLVFAI